MSRLHLLKSFHALVINNLIVFVMETPFKPVLSYTNRISIRLLLCCLIMSGTGIKSFASPDDLIQRSKAHLLTSWNIFGTTSWEDDSDINPEAAPVALSCIPDI